MKTLAALSFGAGALISTLLGREYARFVERRLQVRAAEQYQLAVAVKQAVENRQRDPFPPVT